MNGGNAVGAQPGLCYGGPGLNILNFSLDSGAAKRLSANVALRAPPTGTGLHVSAKLPL